MDTNNKLKKLTEKIYFEGIEKANKEAETIIENARKEADSILGQAKKKEQEIIEQAQKKANEVKKNIDAEIRMASQQFVNNLKQQIVELITHKQVEVPVKEAFSDKSFVQNMILTTIKNWNGRKNGDIDIRVLLPLKEEKELRDFFHLKAKDLLNSGLEIDFHPTIQSGFKIGPKNGNYHISFTDNDFKNYFKNYVKDKTKKIIFEN